MVQKQSLRVMHEYRLQDMLFKVTVEPVNSNSEAPILFDIMDAIQAAIEAILNELKAYAEKHPHKDEEHQVRRNFYEY